jgi:hypothetical protein
MLVLLFACAVVAQESEPSSTGSVASQQTRREPQGLLESIGRWFEDGAARFNSNMRDARGTLDNLGGKAKDAAKDAAVVTQDAAKDAVDAAAKLPGTRVVEGKERCAVAPNGAPDCRVAAEAVCRGKGFASGKSLKTQAAKKCPVQAWLSGNRPNASDCDTEYFVTSAMCQ